MKKLLCITGLLLSTASQADVTVGGVAYEATFTVDGDFGNLMNYQIDGETTTRWFAGNMAVNLSVTCTSPELSEPLVIGENLEYGQRFDGHSYRAKPWVNEKLTTDGNCKQMTVRLDKVGGLSRQFYTIYTDLSFRVKVLEF